MAPPHSLPYYTERYFEYKELKKTFGKPTLDKIIQIYRQLKRNTRRIPDTLGGGDHGYLALVLTPIKYLNISGTMAFNRPQHPGIFTTIGSRRAPAAGIHILSGREAVAPRGGGVD